MAEPDFRRIRTRRGTQRRIFYLVALLGSAQFFLNGFALILDDLVMIGLWVAAGLSAAVGSVVFEIYKSRQARW